VPAGQKSVHTTTLKDRLSAFANEVREKAKSATGMEREELLKKVQRADIAASFDVWASSQGSHLPD
jgi:hypothetical protein